MHTYMYNYAIEQTLTAMTILKNTIKRKVLCINYNDQCLQANPQCNVHLRRWFFNTSMSELHTISVTEYVFIMLFVYSVYL